MSSFAKTLAAPLPASAVARSYSEQPFAIEEKPKRPAFSAAGCRNKSHRGTFESFPASVVERYPYGNPRPSVDKNGAPQLLHRGLTGVRQKTSDVGVVGAGVPTSNQRLDGSKDLTWVPNEYVEPKITHTFRHRGSHREARMADRTKNGFLSGMKKSTDLFDPTVRLMAPIGSFAPDTQLLSWLAPQRVTHERGFVPRTRHVKAKDRGFLTGHAPFPYMGSPYEESEKIIQSRMSLNSWSSGFRPRKRETMPARPPMRPATASLSYRDTTVREAPRNVHMVSVLSADQTGDHHADLVRQVGQLVSFERQRRPQTAGL